MPTAPRPFLHVTRVLLIGLFSTALAAITLAGPVPAAHAATFVTNEIGLRTQLAAHISPLHLGTSFTVTGNDLTISANTTINLEDRKLTTKNIIVNPGVTLTIESAGAQGALTVIADQGAGIRTTGATLIINGGIISIHSPYGHAGVGGARGIVGISGGSGGAGGTTIINGGTVDIAGGGAGIGGGVGGDSLTGDGGPGGRGGETTINGDTVTVVGNGGAGIGGGEGAGGFDAIATAGGDGGTTTITNGVVRATGNQGAGIGGGKGGDLFAENAKGSYGATAAPQPSSMVRSLSSAGTGQVSVAGREEAPPPPT